MLTNWEIKTLKAKKKKKGEGEKKRKTLENFIIKHYIFR